ncbi:MAG: PAS domain-containing protein, partial [Planctomycetales bacterium]
MELDASRDRYIDLYDSAPTGYMTVSKEGFVVEANLTAANLLGIAREALVNQPIDNFILPDDQDVHYVHHKHLVETGEPQTCELRMIRLDSPPFWVQMDATIAQDKNGMPVYRVILSDITERKQVAAELDKHRKHLEKLVEERTAELAQLNIEQQVILNSTRMCIWYKDTENSILRVNRAAAESVGMSAEEIEGKPCEEVFPEDVEKYYLDDLEVIQSGEAKMGIEEQLQTASGEKRWVMTDKIPVVDGTGHITGITVFSLDITDRKQAELDLENRNDKLRQVVNLIAGRENRMVDLKKVIKKLHSQLKAAGMTPVADDSMKSGLDLDPGQVSMEG